MTQYTAQEIVERALAASTADDQIAFVVESSRPISAGPATA